jgi:tight adherence protein C
MGSILFYITLAFVAASVFLLAMSLYPQRFFSKARSQADASGGGAARAAGGLLVGRLGNLNRPLVSQSFRKKMTQRFVTMGNPHMRAEDFIAYQEISAIIFTVAGLLLLNLIQKPLILGLIFTMIGFVLPFIWLRDQIKKRHHKIQRALPYSIDLLTLSVEAGLDFQAAIAKVVEKGQQGPLREELSIMLGEIKLGKTREQALRNLGDRVRLPQLTAFVSNLIQADRMGTSLGKVLRIQSTQMRIERTQRAEKLANEAPVKMLFPLVLCIFPTVFLILFGPILYRLMG